MRSSQLFKAGAALALMTGIVLAPATAFAAGTITGNVSCYWPNADGSTTFSAGYNSTDTTTVIIPVGPNNYVTPAPQDRGQPTTFLPGSHPNTWVATMTAAELNSNPQWFINGTPTSYGSSIPQCATKPVSVSGSTTGYLATTAAIVGIGAYVLSAPRRSRRLGAPRVEVKVG